VVAVIRYGARSAVEDRPDCWAHLRRAGVEEADVVHSRFLARMLVMGAAPSPASGGMAGRAAVDDTGTEGVFMAGDWVGPDGLLADAALASGRSAALSALRHVERSATMVA
ncbi:MAG TPA: hypothetical protein VE991_11165, partial [Acidimicrobiales bacterium]|nr:hypothetical protein [Acidimicrobiales bacterium]